MASMRLRHGNFQKRIVRGENIIIDTGVGNKLSMFSLKDLSEMTAGYTNKQKVKIRKEITHRLALGQKIPEAVEA